MKIAVLWTRLSGYMNASLRELASRPGVELYVAHEATGADAPFANSIFEWIPCRHEYPGAPEAARLLRELNEFKPDVVLASWHMKAFQGACLRLRPRAVTVACADNQWSGSLRQRLAAATSSLHLRRFYDAVFVPGERQAVWARRMGFDEALIWRGMYAGDVGRFAEAARLRDQSERAFVFVGRLATEKGVATLAAAYDIYARSAVAAGEQPWACLVAGAGPLSGLLVHPGFIKLGFVQPEALPDLFARASCLVLPSLREPWGVSLQEAAASALPIICTQVCGAAVHLVQDNYNGFVIDAGNTAQLASAMAGMSRLSAQRREQMSAGSRMLALQFTPERWATTILEKGAELRVRLNKLGMA